jgi:DNA polymerase-3 subunit beta
MTAAMSFTIARADFLRGLRLAAAIADRKSTSPIVAHVLMRVDGKRLHIGATDLAAASLTATLPIIAGTAAGSISVKAKELCDQIAALDTEEVSVKRIDTGWVEVRAGKRIVFKTPCRDGRDFPMVRVPQDGATWHAVSAPALVAGLRATAPAICDDETRFHLRGVFVDGLHLVATDGHRLHLHALPASIGAPQGGGIIPERGVAEIMRLLGDEADGEIAWERDAVFVRGADAVLHVKLTDAQFPPWRQVMPPPRTTLAVDRHDLTAALSRTRRFTSETVGCGVYLGADSPTITVRAHHADAGEYCEDVELADTWPGKSVAIGFAPKYLIEALGVFASDVATIDIGDALDPISITCGATTTVVMPMRLDDK